MALHVTDVTVLFAVASDTDTLPDRISVPAGTPGGGRAVRRIRGGAHQRIAVAADVDAQRVDAAHRHLHTVDRHALKAADVVDRDQRARRCKGRANARVAAEVGTEQDVACKLVQAARRLLPVDRRVQQELVGDAHAAGDHVEVGGRRVVVDGDGVLFDREADRGQAVVEVGVGRRRQRRGHGGLQACAGLGQRLTDPHRELLPIGDRAIAKAGVKRLFEFTLEETLLDDRLQARREVLDAHDSAPVWCQMRRSSSARAACHSS